jgi:hypothetical protein
MSALDNIRENESLQQFIERRIHEIFSEAAEIIGETDLDDMPQEQVAGIPYALFIAERSMISKWREISNYTKEG